MRIMHVVAVAAFGFVFAGCGGRATKSVDGSDVPDWFLKPPKEAGSLYGTGMVDMAGLQLAKETADLRAKKDICNTLRQKITNLLEDHLGQMGEEDPEVTECVQSTARGITEMELIGCTIEKRELKKGKMYSLARYRIDAAARDAIRNIVSGSLTSHQALLSEFRAKQGFERLDKALEALHREEK